MIVDTKYVTTSYKIYILMCTLNNYVFANIQHKYFNQQSCCVSRTVRS